ncbi:kelch-like protein 17 [Gigaspora margarita]|uniref:Kelch-like protein 17 n=1 Tax=Gigaspora margarita TaxID=4874 RepID=A0A8H4EVL4_GIGMA|nr:kelch-like protein 17 [Gigaspora margarita]
MVKFFKNLSNNCLELLNDNEDFNVIIQVNKSTSNKIFKVHSAILRKRPLYFRNEFTNTNSDKTNIFKTIILNHISIEQFEIIIKYIYGKVFSLDGLDVLFIFAIMLVVYEFFLEDL